jgi:hypothetical protein
MRKALNKEKNGFSIYGSVFPTPDLLGDQSIHLLATEGAKEVKKLTGSISNATKWVIGLNDWQASGVTYDLIQSSD